MFSAKPFAGTLFANYIGTTMESVPLIYARLRPAAGMSAMAKILAGLIALGCLATLVIALRLRPDSHGMGTHRQLGFQECGFLERTGLPCPTCGMTTSFAFFAHGRWVASIYVQPAGFCLAVLTGMIFWISLYEALSGQPVHRLVLALPMSYHLLPLMVLIVVGWAWKIFIHVRGIDGWH